MNVVFLTMVHMPSLSTRGIYQDLLRFFVKQGHKVYVVFPRERRLGKPTEAFESGGAHFIGVRTLNLTKSSVVEKGVGQLMVENQFRRAIRTYWGNEIFDLILYSTPPITLMGAVKYLKDRNPQAASYLLLKDIFPQNALDIGMMSTSGLKGILYSFFRRKEKALYRISDYIGCMSPANVEFLKNHNPYIPSSHIEVAPNSIEMVESPLKDGQYDADRYKIRKKYGLPVDKPVFIYGGNLGKPQGIDYLTKCLDVNKYRSDCFFVVIGNGTEFGKLQAWYDTLNHSDSLNVKLMQRLPKEDYDILVRSCDVGLIFLDHRFTIPNYPSRLLSYLENKMPIICATDVNTDIGRIAEENGYGYWCESVKPEDFTVLVDKMLTSDRNAMGENGYQFLRENYQVENTYKAIMLHFDGNNRVVPLVSRDN